MMSDEEIDVVINGAVDSVEIDYEQYQEVYGGRPEHRPHYDAFIARLRATGERLKRLEAENAALRARETQARVLVEWAARELNPGTFQPHRQGDVQALGAERQRYRELVQAWLAAAPADHPDR